MGRRMGKVVRGCVVVLACLSLAVILFAAAALGYSLFFANYEHEMVGWPEKQAFTDPVEWKTDVPGRVRILAIQGGSLYGLSDLEILKAVEERSGKQIHELFDFIAGASTGAIISTLLLNPDEKTGKPISAAAAIDVYTDFAKRVLDAPMHHKVLTGYGFFGPALRNRNRIDVADEIFADHRFNRLLRPAMFPAFSQSSSGLKLFRNWDPADANLYLKSLLSAVTSVPSVFPAVVLTGEASDGGFYGDPALILNSPGEIAYLDARTQLPHVKEFIVVSLGTERDFKITQRTGIDGGILEWFVPVFRMIYRGERTVSLETLQRHAKFDSSIDVTSITLVSQIPLESNSFNPSDTSITAIRQSGRDFVEQNQKQLDDLIGHLTKGTLKNK